MNQIISTQQISNNFGITIHRLSQIYRNTNSVYYKAITIYGSMCLIIENYADSIYNKNTRQFLQLRNKILHKYSQCFPLIYGQEIIISSTNEIQCISLIEDNKFLDICFQEIKNQIRISSIEKLIKSLFYLQNQLLSINGNLFKNQIIYCQSTLQIYINFINIIPIDYKKQQRIDRKLINLIEQIEIYRYNSSQKLKQLILIQDKIYRFDINLIHSAKNLIEIMIMMNICLDLQVEIQIQSISKSIQKNYIKSNKIKSTKIKQFNGQQKFIYNGNLYQSLKFISGKCINCFIQVEYNQLKLKFLKSNTHYRLRKHENFFVQIKQNYEQIHLKQVTITVHPPVSKIQLINFIIIYMKCIQPIIKSIIYNQQQNSIRIEFINKQHQNKSFKIIFYDKYIVKDEQISMIVQRAKLQDCKLDVRYMKINDTLLMFLGNSQKTDKIHQLLLSDCQGLTDHGINVLLVSPYCKNLHSLTLCFDETLLTSSLQLLHLKPNIKKLNLKINNKKNNPFLEFNQQAINLSKIKLIQLSIEGIKININTINSSSLKILKITQYINIDELKYFKQFQLVQLKIKIIQHVKKNIIQSTSHLITGAMMWKQNGIKIFAEGSSSKTLKILDLSQSNIKFKTIRPLLLMPQLQQIILDKCTNLGNEFQPISPKIVKISLLQIPIQIQHLAIILQKIPVLIQLNIINTMLISKNKIITFLTNTKKYIRKLFLSEHNYSNRLIQRVRGLASVINYQMVQSVSLYIDSLLDLDQEHILSKILSTVNQTQKTLNMMTYYGESQTKISDQQQNKRKKLIHKINKFIQMEGKKIQQFNNLSIDNRPFQQISLFYQTVLNTDLNQYLDSSFSLFSCSQPLLPSQPSSKQQNSTSAPINFNVFHYQTIDKLLHRFIRLIRKSSSIPDIIFNMCHNRLIDKSIMNALLKYAQNNIISINFTNCLFNYDQVIDILFEFPYLSEVNNGIYEIQLKKKNFITRTQKYLKFFMKIKDAKTLIIDCLEIQQIQILYTVLYHILDKHSLFLTTLKIRVNTLIINQQSDLFIDKIFNLQNLHELQLQINEYRLKKNIMRNWQDDINNLSSLKILKLKLPSKNYPQLNLKKLQYLYINFSDQDINESFSQKIIKNIYNSPLKQLQLNFESCSNIINLNKIFIIHTTTHLFQKFQLLQKFILNLQFCNLKQQSLNQTIYALTKCDNLKYVQINASFAITNLKDLQHSVHFLRKAINRQIKILIIAATNNSKNYIPNQDFNSQKGIQFII